MENSPPSHGSLSKSDAGSKDKPWTEAGFSGSSLAQALGPRLVCLH